MREELRRRKIKGGNLSREKLEEMLHDAIEKEPCCWGNDCPCVKSGIGCQADTCSCWHPSHDVTHSSSQSSSSSSSNNNKKEDGGSRRVVDGGLVKIEEQCGNPNMGCMLLILMQYRGIGSNM